MAGRSLAPSTLFLATHDTQEEFLESLRELGEVALACERHGIPTTTFYRFRNNNEDFALAVKEALEVGAQARLARLRKSALLDAVYGPPEPIMRGGKGMPPWIDEEVDPTTPKTYEEIIRYALNSKNLLGWKPGTPDKVTRIFLLKAAAPEEFNPPKVIEKRTTPDADAMVAFFSQLLQERGIQVDSEVELKDAIFDMIHKLQLKGLPGEVIDAEDAK